MTNMNIVLLPQPIEAEAMEVLEKGNAHLLTAKEPKPEIVGPLLKEARAVIDREEVIRLSRRDWNWLLDLMGNPREPNAKLKAAVKRYRTPRWA